MRRGLLATEVELAALADRLGRKPFDRFYEKLQRRCALILESGPITETIWQAAYAQGQWRAATSAVADLQGRIFDLVISHRIDRNTAFRDRAVEELRNLVRFSTWVDPSHRELAADVCTAEACATVAVALDWLAGELSEADLAECRRALLAKGIGPYLSAVESGVFWQSCYHHWNAVVNGGTGLAALLLSDEEAAAAEALSAARAGLESFFAALGREGGWDEGLGYWGYAMRYLALFGEALERTGSDGIFQNRGMDATGLFPIYFCPHGLAVSFGDYPLTPAYGALYVLGRRFGLKEIVWWLDRYALRDDVLTSGYSQAGLSLLLRPADVEAEPAPRLEPVKAFGEIGWAALADRWPAPEMYAALKTGDLAAHHAQLDMNSIQLVVGREVLLHDPGSPEFSAAYLSPEGRYSFYEVQSDAHNTVTIDGQDHLLDATGSILETGCGPAYRWAAGDAGGALGDDVHFVRHLVMILDPAGGAGRTLLVLDEVRNVVSEKLRLTWHSEREIELDERQARGRIDGARAVLHVAFAATCPLEAELGRHGLSRRRTDHVLVLSAPATDEAILASVFSTQPVGELTVGRTDAGGVEVRIDATAVDFGPGRQHLKLEKVEP